MSHNVTHDKSTTKAGGCGVGDLSAAASTTSTRGPTPTPSEHNESIVTAATAICPEMNPVQNDVERHAPQTLYTCRFCFLNDNQLSMVIPCNCTDDFSRAHANCVVMQATVNKVHTCPNCHSEFAIRINSQKTFTDWLKDRDHVEDHVKFGLSVFFTFNTIVMLTFAWLYAAKTMPHVSRFLSVPVSVVLLFQSFTWLTWAFFMLWMYRTAYLNWKSTTSTRRQEAGR